MDLHNEIWRPVSDDAYYEVSNLGRVRSLDKIVFGGRGHTPKKRKGRVIKPWLAGPEPKYLCVYLTGRRPKYVHQLVLAAFHGERPEGMHGAHNDGNKDNNCAYNLRWATPIDNNADKIKHGTHLQGTRLPQSKLTEDIVSDLRSRVLKRGDQARIAKELGVSRAVVCEAISGKMWKHVPNIRAEAERLPDQA